VVPALPGPEVQPEARGGFPEARAASVGVQLTEELVRRSHHLLVGVEGRQRQVQAADTTVVASVGHAVFLSSPGSWFRWGPDRGAVVYQIPSRLRSGTGNHAAATVLEVRDRIFAEEGRIGLWTKADAEKHFDDLTVR